MTKTFDDAIKLERVQYKQPFNEAYEITNCDRRVRSSSTTTACTMSASRPPTVASGSRWAARSSRPRISSFASKTPSSGSMHNCITCDKIGSAVLGHRTFLLRVGEHPRCDCASGVFFFLLCTCDNFDTCIADHAHAHRARRDVAGRDALACLEVDACQVQCRADHLRARGRQHRVHLGVYRRA